MTSLPQTIEPGGLLCLDLASISGWFVGPRSGIGNVRFGSWHLSKGILGARFVGYENELLRAIFTFRPSLVIMEAPLPANRQGNMLVARQQLGLAAYTEGVCYREGVSCREQPAGDVRKAMLGKTRFPGGTDEMKRRVVEWNRARGWMVPDHNAADAGILYAFCAEALSGRRPFYAAPQ